MSKLYYSRFYIANVDKFIISIFENFKIIFWVAENSKNNVETSIPDDFTLATIVAGIAGGVESPLQFIFQVKYSNLIIGRLLENFYLSCTWLNFELKYWQIWLILNGTIRSPFEEASQVVIVDFYGNPLTLPTISAFSLVFSMLSILKTVIALNILGIHIKVKPMNNFVCKVF